MGAFKSRRRIMNSPLWKLNSSFDTEPLIQAKNSVSTSGLSCSTKGFGLRVINQFCSFIVVIGRELSKIKAATSATVVDIFTTFPLLVEIIAFSLVKGYCPRRKRIECKRFRASCSAIVSPRVSCFKRSSSREPNSLESLDSSARNSMEVSLTRLMG